MKKKIFITGGSGFIGAGLIDELLKYNYQIICYDNFFRGNKSKLGKNLKNIDFIKGDVRDSKRLIKYSKKSDIIIHLAYINGTEHFYKNPDLVLDVGIKGMLNVIEATKKNNIKNLILASSSEVYQTPKTVPTPENVQLVVPDVYNPRYSYGSGKIISEILALHSSKHLKKVMIFRPHNVYGPNMGQEHVIPQIILRVKKLIKKYPDKKSFNFPILGDGNQVRSFNYISDFSKGVHFIIKKGKHREIYHIGDTKKYKIKDIVQIISKALNVKLIIKKTKAPIGETKIRCPDIKKISRLGYKPKIKIKDGLLKTIDWYMKNNK